MSEDLLKDNKSPFIIDQTPEERQQQLDVLQTQVNQVYQDAAARGLTNEKFAVEIWANTVLKIPVYVAIAALNLNQATNMVGEELSVFLDFLREKTLKGDLERSGWAVQMIFTGLILREKRTVSNRISKHEIFKVVTSLTYNNDKLLVKNDGWITHKDHEPGIKLPNNFGYLVVAECCAIEDFEVCKHCYLMYGNPLNKCDRCKNSLVR